MEIELKVMQIFWEAETGEGSPIRGVNIGVAKKMIKARLIHRRDVRIDRVSTACRVISAMHNSRLLHREPGSERWSFSSPAAALARCKHLERELTSMSDQQREQLATMIGHYEQIVKPEPAAATV